MKLFLCAFLLLFPICSYAADIPAHPTVGETFGVQIKNWRTSKDDYAAMEKMGIDYVRWGMGWQWVEPAPGQYAWSNFDQYMADIRAHHLKSIIILGSDKPPKDIPAFERYITKVVTRYKGDDIIWEIWNEPDTARFWPPKPDADAYVALADVACTAIRKADPHAFVIAPALSGFPALAQTVTGDFYRQFIIKLLASPAGTCINALSVHPYRQSNKPPETVIDEYARAKEFIAANTPPDHTPLPLFNSEWGYTTATGSSPSLTYTPPRISEAEQSDYILRERLVDLISGIPMTIWYEWRNSGQKPDDPEDNFGLLTYDGAPKPAFTYLNTVLPVISHAKFEERLVSPKDDYAVILRQPDNSRTLVYWTSGQMHTANLLPNTTLTLTARPQLYTLKDTDNPVFVTAGH